MRGRRAVAVAALAVVVAAACASSGKLRETTQLVRADIDGARKAGAMRCAPRELALAESNLSFAEDEAAAGHEGRAEEHLATARKSASDALRLSASCVPPQVVIARKAEPRIVRIEKIDRDGDGIPDVDDLCPDEPGPAETHGCPVAKDTDGDGIPDEIDRCPLDPEDKDGFQDEDGCPDPDNDGDGIVDRADACPNDPGPLENHGCPILDRDGDGLPDDVDRCPDEPGPKENGGCPDGDRDGDGIIDRLDRCPDQFGGPPDGCPKRYTLVEVKKERIEIRRQVEFAAANVTVLPASFPLLDQVAQVLRDFPRMRVAIEGHTDNLGGEAQNTRLSQRRAEAVRDYLVAKGISPSRLEAIGYGPTKPIASNKTARGKARNRRTEFRVTARE